ncbi:MAG: SMC-Scp complex subunit ScpB [Selenomonadales bacterium]|jgi:segregation and condensation protein B|nr:SMC-Scp complex subunit ScpB [Selenomonadales bacterium]MBQ5588394.1 SMC-Scp complex subunit ScpB [Selenomonadales bacterium]MBQ5637174.1 SMC-Scp complex subunit ScpB [Selenomonadales bacterium]
MFYEHLKGNIEAVLFAAGQPVTEVQLAEMLSVEKEHIRILLAQMKSEMEDANRGLTILEVAGGYQLCTKAEFAETVARLAEVQPNRLSKAALETLSVIAFKQPITRAEIEEIRGVQVDRVLQNLIDKELIKELGRKEVIGRPILYGTTEVFLNCFGMDSLSDLPPLPDE